MRYSVKRLFQAFSIILLVSCIIGITLVRQNLLNIHGNVGVQNKLTESMLYLKEIRFNTIQIQQFLTDVSATGETIGYEEAEIQLKNAHAYLEKFSNLHPESSQKVTRLKQSVNNFHELGTVMADAYINLGRVAGNEIMQRPDDGFDAVAVNLSEQIESLVSEFKQQLDFQKQQTEETVSQTIFNIMTAGIVVVIVLLVAMLIFYFKLMTPLQSLKTAMHNIAQGEKDLTQRVEDSNIAEISEVAQSFNHFVERLQHTLVVVVQNTLQLIDATNELTSVTKQTSQGMDILKGQSDTATVSMDNMVTSINEVAKNTEHATQSTQSSSSATQNGQREINETVSAIGNLATEIDGAANTIHSLEESSNQIGSILNVIKTIAEQTNLLALNAAIEAARAGEQGRGFAVVADEVRQLAQRTGEATKEIQSMIDTLQSNTQQAVTIMQNSKSLADNSVSQANRTGTLFDSISSAVTEINDMNRQIARSSEQQTSLVTELKSNLSKIDEIIVNTKGESQVSFSSSSSISLMANEVGILLEQFHLGEIELEKHDKLVSWNDFLSVKHDSIDTQHKRLLDMINEMNRALKSKNSWSVAGVILDNLVDYTKSHFSYEEKLMEEHNYQDIEQHKSIHTQLLDKTMGFKERFDNNDETVCNELMNFLQDWLIKHIQHVDMKYSPVLVK